MNTARMRALRLRRRRCCSLKRRPGGADLSWVQSFANAKAVLFMRPFCGPPMTAA